MTCRYTKLLPSEQRLRLAILAPLPPYSLDFNSIKNTSAKLKQRNAAAGIVEDLRPQSLRLPRIYNRGLRELLRC